MPSGTVTGIGSGAAAGAAFGPVGALVGGILGGLAGGQADRQAREARRLLKKANALRTDSTMLRSFAEQRLLLRQGQLAQAQAVASGVASGADISSSGTQGMQSSIRAQMFDNFLLGESILDEQLDANVFEARAKDKLGKAQDIMGLIQFGTSLVGLIPHGPKDSATPGSSVGGTVTSPVRDIETVFGGKQLVVPQGIQTESIFPSLY